MKKLLTIAFTMATAATMYAQGTLNFSNFGGGLNAPDYVDQAHTTLLGSAYAADLLYSSSGNAGTFSDLGLAIAYRDNAGAPTGIFLGNSQAIPGIAGGNNAFIQVVAWKLSDSATYAGLSGNAIRGSSSVIQVPLVTAPGTPNNLVGLQSFNLTPEPATMAMLGLGAGALMLVRRRK